jgi:hypothetical protein
MNLLVRPFAILADHLYAVPKLAWLLFRAAYAAHWHPNGRIELDQVIAALQTVWPRNDDGETVDLVLTLWRRSER